VIFAKVKHSTYAAVGNDYSSFTRFVKADRSFMQAAGPPKRSAKIHGNYYLNVLNFDHWPTIIRIGVYHHETSIIVVKGD